MKEILDPDHLPRITRFQTVIISPAFKDIVGESPWTPRNSELLRRHELSLQGVDGLLSVISGVADRGIGSRPEERKERVRYLGALSSAASLLYQQVPIEPNDVVAPVVRCGANVARKLGIQGFEIEAKRLRIDGRPDLLAAGVNIAPELFPLLKGKRVRLLEGVIASGSTVCVMTTALRNFEVRVSLVDCDAAITCPAGLAFSADYRMALNCEGSDRALFIGGELNSNWYVVYSQNDPLLRFLGENRMEFVGKQVLGDGGDLTSNIN